MTQEEALDILKIGHNVFLTGSPGSGKTHTINEYVAYLRSHDIEPAITASTGISATHIGGLTIHSWSGIGIKNTLNKHDLKKIASTNYITRRIKRAKVLIIDEVSMLSPGTFSMIDAVCRQIKDNTKSFGGIQIVSVGDFFQLPPISKKEAKGDLQMALIEESASRFAYESLAWEKAKFTVCYLTEQHRQDDGNFLDVLSAIRRNEFNNNHLHHIKARKINYDLAPATAPKLFSYNADVNRINNEILDTLSGQPKIFNMHSEGPEPPVLALKKGCLSPDALCLKTGASVMFTKNNPKEGFVNGTLGTVEGFAEHTSEPIVKTRDGKRITVDAMDWTMQENGKVRAKISQFPLRLAWAITVHKSQGMSLDEAVMDLGNVFEFGQGYVALSRVRRLSGLYLLGWNDSAFKVHPEVLEKDLKFQAESKEAMHALGAITRSNIKKIGEQFILACDGKIILENNDDAQVTTEKTFGAIGFKKIREKYPSAYLPWDKDQDIELKELFTKGLSIVELTTAFNRTRGSITSRLKKLGLLDY